MKEILKAFWPTVYKYRRSFTAMTLFMVLTVMARAVYPYLLRDLLGGLNSNSSNVWHSFLMIVGLAVVSNIIEIGFDIAKTLFDIESCCDIDRRSFNAVQSQSMRFFDNSFAGSLVASAKRFSNALEGFCDIFMYQLGRSVVMVIITFCVFVWERPLLALIFAVWLVLFGTMCFWFSKLRLTWTVDANAKDSLVSAGLSDSFANHAAVKSFAKEQDEQGRFNKLTEDCCFYKIKARQYKKVIVRVQTVILAAFEMLVLFILIRSWRDGTMNVGDFVFFQTYVLMMLAQTSDIGASFHAIFRYVADAKEMAGIYAKESEVQDVVGARPLVVDKGEIEFRDVSFKYDNHETCENTNINNLSLKVKPGQTLAIVGQSGAGKSTLVKLLLRYFDLGAGYIYVDGQNIANVTQLSLRQKIAVVPQSPCLFHRSLRENIAFARPDASEKEIVDAARRAHAWEFIQSKQCGLDTLVGERGVKLSGGELQRIALARAFLANTPIIVLDEATSSLDSETEYQIQSAIKDLLYGRTCIVIAHRLSTIRYADRIIVMDNGSIVESGKHSELLRQKGVYANLWHRQSSYLEE